MTPLISKKYYFSVDDSLQCKFYKPKKIKMDNPRVLTLHDFGHLFFAITSLKLGQLLYDSFLVIKDLKIPSNIFPSLTKINFKYYTFSPPLPPTLKNVTIAYWELIDELPDSVTHIKIDDSRTFLFPKKFPPKLTHFSATSTVGVIQFPATITHFQSLNMSPYTTNQLPKLHKVGEINSFTNMTFPTTITEMKFHFAFNKSISCLQSLSNLKTVIFGCYFNQPVNLLPPSVKHLWINENFEVGKLKNLPEKMQLLKLTIMSETIDFDFCKIQAISTITHLAVQITNITHFFSIPPNLTHLQSLDYSGTTLFIKEWERALSFFDRNSLVPLVVGKFFEMGISNKIPIFFEFSNNKSLYFLVATSPWVHFLKCIKNGRYKYEEISI